ncbi:MAG TPA: hypothetical protein VJ124_00730, partial [Pyrinomonadaceae bacterium]|nr:hypothetical protein [Pyrinomonadaceae bacterium]
MPIPYDLTLQIDETGDTASLSGELSDSEAQLLQDFVQYSKEVLSTDFIQRGQYGQLEINWKQGSGAEIK